MGKRKTVGDSRTVFFVDEAEVKLVHKNERLEKHGEESVLACDLEFEWETDNGVLACFAPALRSALYEKQTGQGELIPDDNHITHLRFPLMGRIKWEGGELVGAVVRFHGATGPKSDVVLETVGIKKYRIEPKEGGTVVVYFQAQTPITESLSGKLSKFLQQGLVSLSVVPPGADDSAGAEA